MSFVVIFRLNNTLSFGRVDSISVQISPPDDPPFALSSPISPGDKGDIIGGGTHMCESNIDEP